MASDATVSANGSHSFDVNLDMPFHISNASLATKLTSAPEETHRSPTLQHMEEKHENGIQDVTITESWKPRKLTKFLDKYRKRDRALCILPVRNSTRKALVSLTSSPHWDGFFLTLVFANCIILAMADPTQEETSAWNSNLAAAEFVLTLLFTFESVVMILAYGLVWGPHAYLRSPWSRFDFLIVISSWMEFIPGVTGFSFLRTLRVLKSLRTINRKPNLRILVITLLRSVPLLADVVLCLIFIITVFAIIGVQLFAGRLTGHCIYYSEVNPTEYPMVVDNLEHSLATDQSWSDLVLVPSAAPTIALQDVSQNCDFDDPDWLGLHGKKCSAGLDGIFNIIKRSAECEETSRNPLNGFLHFDSFPWACMAIWQCFTLSNWDAELRLCSNAVGSVKANGFFYALIIVGAFCSFQLTAAVLTAKFQQSSVENGVSNTSVQLVSSESMISSLNKMFLRSLTLTRSPPSTPSRKSTSGSDWTCNWIGCIDALFTEPSRWSDQIEKFVQGKTFAWTFRLLTLLNITAFALEYSSMSDTVRQIALWTHLGLAFPFTFEMTLKLMQFGFLRYIKHPLLLTDLVVNLFSIVLLLKIIVTGDDSVMLLFSIVFRMRALRIQRIFLKDPEMAILYKTIEVGVRALSDFCLMFLLFLFVFIIVGMQLLGAYHIQELAERRNFRSFGFSFLTIFEVLTGNDWDATMRSYMAVSSEWVAIFFLFLVIFGNLMLLTLCMAILIDAIKSGQDGEMQAKVQVKEEDFRKCSLLQTLDSETLQPLLPRIKPNIKAQGDCLASNGSEVSVVFYIVAGRINLVDDENNVIESYRRGQWLGSDKLMVKGAVWTGSLFVASSNCCVLRLARYNFTALMRQIPAAFENHPTLSEEAERLRQQSVKTTKELYEDLVRWLDMIENPYAHWLRYRSPVQLAVQRRDDASPLRVTRNGEATPKKPGIFSVLDKLKEKEKAREEKAETLIAEKAKQVEKRSLLSVVSDLQQKNTEEKAETLNAEKTDLVSFALEDSASVQSSEGSHGALAMVEFGQNRKFEEDKEPVISSPPFDRLKDSMIPPGNPSRRISDPLPTEDEWTSALGVDVVVDAIIDSECPDSQEEVPKNKKEDASGRLEPAKERKETKTASLGMTETVGVDRKGSVGDESQQSVVASGSPGSSPKGQKDKVGSASVPRARTRRNSGIRPTNAQWAMAVQEVLSTKEIESLENEGSATATSNPGPVNPAPVAAPTSQEQDLEFEEDVDFVQAKEYRSLFLFPPKNRLRRTTMWIVNHPLFDPFILICVLTSSLALALDYPKIPKDSVLKQGLDVLDKVFIVIFLIELGLKVVSWGLILHPGSYLRSGWCQLDFVIVASSVPELFDMGGLSALRTLRVMRALRPLRTASRLPGLKLVVETLFLGFKKMKSVLIFGLYVFFIFALVGVPAFGGQFVSCSDPTIEWREDCVGWMMRDSGTVFEQRTLTTLVYNFDNVGIALVSLFVAVTTNKWVELEWAAMDIDSERGLPNTNNSPYWAVFFVSFLCISTFLWVNLMVSVVVDTYESLQSNKVGKEDLRLKMSLGEWYSQLQEENAVAAGMKAEEKKEKPIPAWRQKLLDIANGAIFNRFIVTTITLNVIMMTTYYYKQPDYLTTVQERLSDVFNIIYTFEMLFKWLALTPRVYFQSGWNCLDFVVVVATLLMYAIGEGIQMIAVLRVARLFTVIKNVDGLRVLIKTLFESSPAMINVGAVMLLMLFVFSVMAMHSFGDFEDEPSHSLTENPRNDYRTFHRSAFTLITVFTGTAFYDQLSNTFRKCDDPQICVTTVHLQEHFPPCNSFEDFGNQELSSQVYQHCTFDSAAPIIFISFFVIESYLVLNIFVAAMLSRFIDACLDEALLTSSSVYQNVFRNYLKKRVSLCIRKKVAAYRASREEDAKDFPDGRIDR